MKKMNGKPKADQITNGVLKPSNDSFSATYLNQIEFQKEIIKKYQSHLSNGKLPVDNPELFQYHMTAIVEELGEVLKADKRWKTHRNDAFDPENKMEEISDVFITFLNICIFSGYKPEDIMYNVNSKIKRNLERMINN